MLDEGAHFSPMDPTKGANCGHPKRGLVGCVIQDRRPRLRRLHTSDMAIEHCAAAPRLLVRRNQCHGVEGPPQNGQPPPKKNPFQCCAMQKYFLYLGFDKWTDLNSMGLGMQGPRQQCRMVLPLEEARDDLHSPKQLHM